MNDWQKVQLILMMIAGVLPWLLLMWSVFSYRANRRQSRAVIAHLNEMQAKVDRMRERLNLPK